MTRISLLVVWVLSFALAASVFYLISPPSGHRKALISEAVSEIASKVPRPEIIIIGSSLTGAAFFVRETGTVLDGVTSLRLSLPGVNQSDILSMAESALNANPRHIILEVEILTRDNSPEPHLQLFSLDTLAEDTNWYLLNLWRGRENWYNTRFNREPKPRPAGEDAEELELSSGFMLRTAPLKELPRWRAFLEAAKGQNTKIALIGYPRSRAAADFLDKQVQSEVDAAALAFAKTHNLPHFKPEGVWPNGYFRDASHLNPVGRDRYTAELRQWWKGRE